MNADTVTTRAQFTRRWCTPPNFYLHEWAPAFDFPFPAIEEVLEILRKDEAMRVTFLTGEAGYSSEEAREMFYHGPVDRVHELPFRLVHWDLHRFYRRGGFLERFQDRVMIPWRSFLSELGFTWHRCYPILFISTRGCSSTYHVDQSHGMVWQVLGSKRFNSYRTPAKFLPRDFRTTVALPFAEHPPEHDAAERLSMEMHPGDRLWSHLLTPHWVTCLSDISLSITISHGGLRYRGRGAKFQDYLTDRWREYPDELWLSEFSTIRF